MPMKEEEREERASCLAALQVNGKPDREVRDVQLRRGRKSNGTCYFDHRHPLHAHYKQVLLSKLKVPKNAGPAPPREPPFLGDGEVPTAAWLTKRALFARYMVALFVPWACVPEELALANPELEPCPPPLTEATLQEWLTLQAQRAAPERGRQGDEAQQDGDRATEVPVSPQTRSPRAMSLASPSMSLRRSPRLNSESGLGCGGEGEEQVEDAMEGGEVEDAMEPEAAMEVDEDDREVDEDDMEVEDAMEVDDAMAADEAEEAEAAMETEVATASLEAERRPDREVTVTGVYGPGEPQDKSGALAPMTVRGMERTIARGRMWSMHQYSNALKVTLFSKHTLTQFRMQNRRMWTCEEKEAAKARTSAGDDEKAKRAAKAIEELRARAESRKMNVARLEAATKAATWVGSSLGALKLEVPPFEDQSISPSSQLASSPAAADRPLPQSILHRDADDVTEVLKAVMHAPSPEEVAAHKTERAAYGNSKGANSSGDGMPEEFCSISDLKLEAMVDEWKAEVAQWELLYGKGCIGAEAPEKPPPPMNHEQRTFCQKMVRILQALSARRRQCTAKTRPRDEYMTNFNLQMQHLLIGQAGAGKSEMLKCLRRVMAREDLGGMASSAFTGVAVTQLIDAYTLCKLSGLPGTAQSRQQQYHVPSEEQMSAFDRMVHGKDNLSILVIDEMSFIGCTFLHHLDIRLQALLECNQPFGGLLVILTGDFHVRRQASMATSPSLPTPLIVSASTKRNLRSTTPKSCHHSKP